MILQTAGWNISYWGSNPLALDEIPDFDHYISDGLVGQFATSFADYYELSSRRTGYFMGAYRQGRCCTSVACLLLICSVVCHCFASGGTANESVSILPYDFAWQALQGSTITTPTQEALEAQRRDMLDQYILQTFRNRTTEFGFAISPVATVDRPPSVLQLTPVVEGQLFGWQSSVCVPILVVADQNLAPSPLFFDLDSLVIEASIQDVFYGSSNQTHLLHAAAHRRTLVTYAVDLLPPSSFVVHARLPIDFTGRICAVDDKKYKFSDRASQMCSPRQPSPCDFVLNLA